MHAHVEPKVRDEQATIARSNDRSLAGEIRRALAAHPERKEQNA